MKARPLVYVTDIERSLAFYRLLGLEPTGFRRGNIAEVAGDGLVLALHRADPLPPTTPKPRVLLTFEADRPLAQLAAHLDAAGVEFERRLTDEAYGHSIAVRDPDGLVIQINHHEVRA